LHAQKGLNLAAKPTAKQVLVYAAGAKEKYQHTKPHTNSKPLNGVSTFDLVLITKHILNGKNIVEVVLTAGQGLTNDSAAAYDSRMRVIVAELERLSAPDKENQCLLHCSQTHRGVAQVWNRFGCMAACLD